MEPADMMDQLKGLLSGKSQGEIGKLKEMLEFLDELKDKCRAEFQESEVELEKNQADHAERMRALELGRPISDKGEIGKAHSAIWAAGIIGLFVCLALIGGAIANNAMVMRFPSESTVRIGDLTLDRPVALILGVWAACGFATVLIAFLSLRTIRRAREWVPPIPKTFESKGKRVDEKPITWNQ